MPKPTSIELMDTTLRDGEQTQGVSFTPLEKFNIAKSLLKNLRIDRIEVASARISEGEKEAVTTIAEWAASEGHLEQVEVLGFVDHHQSVDWIHECGAKVLNLLAKGSELHCRKQLKKDLNQHLDDIRKTLDYANQKGLTVNIYLEDWSNGYANSPQYVYDFITGLKDTGVQRFMLPDTLGVMSPEEVFASISDMVSRFPWAHFDFHPHNDYGLGAANALFAVKAGAQGIHCTMNCLGERAGNAALPEVAVILKDKLQLELSIDESRLSPLSDMVGSFSGKPVSSNTPIVGENVFTQTSGIHADGDKKGGLYHNPLSPERFGKQRSYALGKMSGKASLAKNLEELGLQLSEENQKKVLQRIVELGDSKKQITPADLPFIITDVLEGGDTHRIKLINCTITSGFEVKAIASIRLSFDGQEYMSTGAGNGGYDAFMDALKAVLTTLKIDCPQLVDYQIHIPKGGKTSALTEAVITWQSGHKRFKTISVDSDQVIAAAQATIKMLNLVVLSAT